MRIHPPPPACRREFGRPTRHFADAASRHEWEIEGSEELSEKYLERNPCTLEFSFVPRLVHVLRDPFFSQAELTFLF